MLFSRRDDRSTAIAASRRRWPSARGDVAPVPLAMVLMLAACAAQPAGPDPTGSRPALPPSASAAYVSDADPAWIPVDALLQPDDLGPGHHVENELTYQPGTYSAWSFGMDGCPAVQGIDSFGRYAFMRFHAVVPDGHTIGAPGTVWADTRRYSEAATVVADTRQALTACPSYNSMDTAGVPADGNGSAAASRDPAHVANTWTVVGKGFAGNDSLLVRHETVVIDDSTGQQFTFTGESGVTIYALVRVADLVTVLQSYTADSTLLRDLGAKAAARLCVAAIPRC